MSLDPFTAGWIMGGLTGSLFGVMATVTFQWWTERRIRHIDMDDRWERLRALDRHPTRRIP